MNIRKITAIITCIILLTVTFAFTACDKDSKDQGGNSNISSADNNDERDSDKGNDDKDDKDKGEIEAVKEIKLSFANSEYVESGDESLPKLIVGVKGEISVSEDKAKEVAAAIEQLKNVPDGVANAETFVTDEFKIGDIKFNDKNCTIDLSEEVIEADLNTEQFFVYQVVNTLINSFDDIESVSFTVKGNAVDTLAGHMDMSNPFTAEMVNEFNESE